MDQANLFHPRSVMPTWETLPAETRVEVTRLVARMLIAYQARQPGADGMAAEEVRHD